MLFFFYCVYVSVRERAVTVHWLENLLGAAELDAQQNIAHQLRESELKEKVK